MHGYISVKFVKMSHGLLPSVMLTVGRVVVAKLLGVYLKYHINFSQHVESTVATCNQNFIC